MGGKRESVQLFEGHVGGGFGIRGELYPEDVLVCAAALHFRRPVKWIEDRREHLIAANHSRQQHHHIRAAIDGDGRILGIDDEFFHDQGAYMRTHAATVPDLAAAMLPGPYRVPAYRAIGHIRLTNKTPCGTYRAPGRYESTFVRERLLDAIAAKIGVDGVEVRRRNLIGKSAMPYALGLETLGTHIVYDSGDYAGLLDKALAAADWNELQDAIARDAAPTAKRSAPASPCSSKRAGSGRSTPCASTSRRRPFEVVTGVASLGQGVETVIAQICADALGVDYADGPRHPRPDRPHRQGHGRLCLARHRDVRRSDTACRHRRCAKRRSQAPRELMQTGADGLDIVEWRDRPRRRRRPVDAASANWRARYPTDLSAEDTFESAHMVYPYGVHVAVVRVDADTGGVTIERYSSPTTSARRSIRCWSRARSPAAWRRASAARCLRSFSTTRAASRSRSPSPTI